MKNNYKTTLRNIKNNKLNTIIKVLGVSCSLITLLFIIVFVQYETSYDAHIPEADNIYRVVRNWQESETFSPSTPAMLTTELNNTFAEIESSTRFAYIFDATIVYNNQAFKEDAVEAVDSSFFSTFNLSLIQGDLASALSQPGSVVISKSKSKAYFGNDNPIGQQIELESGSYYFQNNVFTVTGIFNDYPTNTHFSPAFLVSLNSCELGFRREYTSHSLGSYIRLKDNTDPTQIEARLPAFMRNFYGDEYYDFARNEYRLQPITNIHLDTWVYPYGYETAMGNSSSLFLFPLLAVFVLAIASINYLNLTISEGIKRAKSFGVNKLSGANKSYFIGLFSAESNVIVAIAIAVVVVVCPILLPYFNALMDRHIEMQYFLSLPVMQVVLLVVVSILVLFSLVPVLVFMRKKALDLLSGKGVRQTGKSFVYSVSQTIQFSICIFLFIGAIMVYKQLNYMHHKTNEAMNVDNVMVMYKARYLGNSHQAFKQQLKNIPGVKSVSLCNEIPGNGNFSNWGGPIDKALESAHVNAFYCDQDYFKTLSIDMKQGRFLSREFSTDVDAMVLNESAVKRLGWQDDPIGKRYYLGKEYHVIGVAPNIHIEGLQYEIEPTAFVFNRNETSAQLLIAKINSTDIQKTIKAIEFAWNEFVPNRKFDYGFINQEFEQWYKSTRRTSVLSIILSLVAIALASLGLLAAILYKIESRIKEIGIRKVNGAKVKEVIALLNKDFIIWVVLAFIIASPIAYFGVSLWLQSFAYKTLISWWVFILAGLFTLGIALLTVSWQSWKAARQNPVEALRYE